MNNCQKNLIILLSCAIRNNKPPQSVNIENELQDLYDEARAHQVHALLFPIIKELYLKERGLDPGIMELWKKSALVEGLNQVQQYGNISRTLDAFNQAGIQVIALKGLIIRELYPHPELRTMSDADILVREDQFDAARALLSQNEYLEDHIDYKHAHFSHRSQIPIELHRKFIKTKLFTNSENWESKLWKCAIRTEINSVPVWSLSLVDQLLQICLHMAGHFISNGFGLRQLCDLVLFVEAYESQLDWLRFLNESDKLGIRNFVISIFYICKKLFNLKIPEILYNRNFEDEPNIELIIEDILAGGVYGTKTSDRGLNGLYIHYMPDRTNTDIPDRLRRILFFMFPPRDKLDEKYGYAIKYSFLIPLAWAHRCASNIIRRKQFIFGKSALFSSNSEIAFENRFKLLQWLDLI